MAFDWESFYKTAPKAQNEYKNYQKEFTMVPAVDDSRGLLDRVFDALQIGNYATAGALYNATDKDPNTSMLGGVVEGIKAGNPLGKGNESGEKVFGDVLGNVGWNPEHLSGKVAKGAVGLAGDIFLDPLSYVNPISAASKVVGGTGKVSRGFKLPMISLDDAEKAVRLQYEKVGVKIDDAFKLKHPNLIEDEAAKLQTAVNQKMMKVRNIGEDFQLGGKNLPFASKIKVPGTGKHLDDFTTTLIEAKKLRAVGDKTIAPYYNGLVNRIKDTKMIRKFRKDMDIYDMAKTDPVRAASMYRLKELTKGISGVGTDRDINALLESNIIADLYNNLEDAKQFVDDYDKGILTKEYETRGYLAKKVDKVKGTNTQTEKIKSEEKIIKKTYDVLKQKINNGELAPRTPSNLDKYTMDAMLENNPNDFIDDMLSGSMRKKIEQFPAEKFETSIEGELNPVKDSVGGFTEIETDPLNDEFNELIRNIARRLNVDGYDDLEKSFDSAFKDKSSSVKLLDADDADVDAFVDSIDNEGKVFDTYDEAFGNSAGQDADYIATNKAVSPEIQAVLDAKLEEIKPLFFTGKPYHKQLAEDFIKSQISGATSIKGADDFYDIGQMLKESHLNLSKYTDASKNALIKELNNLYFNGAEFIPYSISDDIVDDLVKAGKNFDEDTIQTILYDVLDARPVKNKFGKDVPGPKLFDAVTQEFNEKFGFRLAKPSPAWNTGVKGSDGKYIYEQVRLRDIPQLTREYLAIQDLEKLQKTLDEYTLRGNQIQETLDNFISKIPTNELPIGKTSYDYEMLRLTNEMNNIRNKIEYGKELLKNAPKIKKYRIMLEETAYGLRLTDAKYSINKKRPSLDELKKLTTFDESRLETFSSGIHKKAINKYNRVNGTKIGYDFQPEIDYTEHQMQRDIDSFNAEKTDDKALIERGIDISEDAEGNLFYDSQKPLSETLTYDQWKSSEFQRKQKIAAQLLNGPGEVEELTSELKGINYRLNNFKRSKNNEKYLQDVARKKEILETLNKNRPTNFDDAVNKQITDAVEPETTAIDHIKNASIDAPQEEVKVLEDIKEAIETSLPPAGEPMGKDEVATNLYELLTKRMNEIGQKEVNYGKLSQEALDKMTGRYMPHIRTTEALEYVKAHADEMYDSNGGYNPSWFAAGYEETFNKGRVFDSLEEANRIMSEKTGVEKWFEDDLVKAIEARTLAHNNLIYNEDMVKAVRAIAGEDFEFGKKIPGMTAVVSFVDLNHALLSKFKGNVPKEFFEKINEGVDEGMKIKKEFFSPNNAYIPVTDDQVKRMIKFISTKDNAGEKFRGLNVFNLDNTMIKRLNRESQIQKRLHTNNLLNIYDRWLSVYKNINTTIMPGFHAQNALSNEFQMYLADGASVLDPRKLKNAVDIYTNKTPNKMIKLGKIDLTHRQIKELAEKYGILDNTFFKEDLRFGTAVEGVGKKIGVPGKVDPTDLNNFGPYRAGAKVGSSIEGSQRLVLFIEELKRGKSMKEAVDQVNKYMFDYGDLTDFEKDTMKRVIPFYTFMRKNIPMELNEMIENPNKFRNVDKALDEVEGMSGEERVQDSQRNKWRKDHVQMPFKLDGQNFGINPQLPYQQLDRLTPRKILGQTTPAIKSPLEILTGKYAYNGMDIGGPVEYLASQLAPTKMINQQADKEGIKKQLYIMSQLGGFPMGTL